MQAPDKIYIEQDMINNIPLERQDHEDDVIYIRKDALLEFLNGLDTNSNYERFVIDNLIEHINSL